MSATPARILPPQLFRPTLIQAEAIRNSFRTFVKEGWRHVDPAPLDWNWHMDALCDHYSYMTMGDIRFLMINIQPRTSKSLIGSVFWPVWDWLHCPWRQYLTASYALQLSIRDCLRSRRLIDSPWFQERWGHEFSFMFDEKLKRQYSNDKGGRRIALATESTTTGEGGDMLNIDDPHNATEIESEAIRLGTHDWWDNAMSSRLNQPDVSGWVLNGQRTGRDDLFGHVLDTHDTKELVHLVLPNEYRVKHHCVTRIPSTGKKIFSDPRTTEGELMNPKRTSESATKRLRRVMKAKYHLQYQQDAEAGEGAILARKYWQEWSTEEPELEMLISCYDTAYEEKEENDYSARTDWGVFLNRQKVQRDDGVFHTKERRCAILLGAWRDKVPYHELKRLAKRHDRKLKPDYTLIEKKGAGISLAQDLIRAGVKGVRRVKLDHGGRVKNDKVTRANLASTVLDDGLVYFIKREWSKVVIDECAAFPKGSHDDFVDTCLMAWMFLRRMGKVELWEAEEPDGTVRLFKRAKPKRGSRYG